MNFKHVAFCFIPLAASWLSMVLNNAVVRVHIENTVKMLVGLRHMRGSHQNAPMSIPVFEIMKRVLRPSLSTSSAAHNAQAKFQT